MPSEHHCRAPPPTALAALTELSPLPLSPSRLLVLNLLRHLSQSLLLLLLSLALLLLLLSLLALLTMEFEAVV